MLICDLIISQRDCVFLSLRRQIQQFKLGPFSRPFICVYLLIEGRTVENLTNQPFYPILIQVNDPFVYYLNSILYLYSFSIELRVGKFNVSLFSLNSMEFQERYIGVFYIWFYQFIWYANAKTVNINTLSKKFNFFGTENIVFP